MPAERVLAETLGLSRAALRKGLAPLEAAGLLVRQVGRGTFVRGGEHSGLDQLGLPQSREARRWPDHSPRELIGARLAIEPRLGALAAREATAAQIEELRQAAAAMNDVRAWSSFDDADEAFHRAIARCCANPILLHLFDQLAEARRLMHWGRLRERSAESPMPAAAVIEGHARIVEAIADRDAHRAEDALAHHLMVEAATTLGGLP